MSKPTAAQGATWMPAPDRVGSGMALMIAAMLAAPGIDALAKLATAEATPPQIGLARFVVQTALLAPLMLLGGRLVLPTAAELGLHAARGALMGAATVLFFTALTRMAVADAIAIFFVEPMILTLLSALILREQVGWRRYAACLVGFGGALLIIQPKFDDFGWLAAAPVGAAFCFALYLILTRRAAQRAHPIAIQFWAGLFGALTVGGAIAAGGLAGSTTFRLAPVSDATLWLLFGVGACATVAHLAIVAAFARAPASVLAPFQYLEILSATALGYLIFGDFPDALTWVGIAIITGSGLVIVHRERLAEKRARAQARLSSTASR